MAHLSFLYSDTVFANKHSIHVHDKPPTRWSCPRLISTVYSQI